MRSPNVEFTKHPNESFDSMLKKFSKKCKKERLTSGLPVFFQTRNEKRRQVRRKKERRRKQHELARLLALHSKHGGLK